MSWPKIQFSTKSLLVLPIAAIIALYAVMNIGPRIMADGGGNQKISLSIDSANVRKIEVAPVRAFQDIDEIKSGLASTDLNQKLETIDFDTLQTFDLVSDSIEIVIRQSWSETVLTTINRRMQYGQTYRYAVMDLKLFDGRSIQQVVELPEYCHSVDVDLTRETKLETESQDNN